MIFLHRFNKNELTHCQGIEIDVRLYNGKVILTHDYYTNGELVFLEDCLNNFAGKTILVDVKESQIEDHVNKILKGFDYYFLDSQIPDIIRLSKTQNNFVIRNSKYEKLTLADEINAKYRWIDYFDFDNFNIYDYISYVSKFKGCNNIIVSPELYSYKYYDIMLTLINVLPKGFSVCTDYPDLWSKYYVDNERCKSFI